MTTPKISVCMPMFNASRYLRECIDSILAQTFTDFELLIADDGSTDNSVEIVASYADPRIRLIRRPHDYIATLNCLLNEAKGEYIARMDADDVMLPNRLQLQVDYMDANPEVDVLGGSILNDDDTQTFIDERPNSRIITLKALVEDNQINHPTVILRTKTIRELGLQYSQDYIYAEDYKLWSEFVRNGRKIVSLDIPAIYYRTHSEQISHQKATLQHQTYERIKRENRLYAIHYANKTYVAPIISPSGNKLTVIIPFLNEGQEVVNTVASVREFAKDSVDIIVINDASYDGIDYGALLAQYNVHYLVNTENHGVAASRDIGVDICRTPYFLLLDAHMRFYESECFDTICRLLTEDDRRLLCCQSIAIDPDPSTGEMLPRAGYPIAFGAYLTMKIGDHFLHVDWKNIERNPGCDIEEIPVVLGAGYAASRRYWLYLRGLRGLRCYGSDECYISLKIWLEGGTCVLLKRHILGHYYRTASPYLTFNSEITYNALLIASTLLPAKERAYCFASYMFADYPIFTQAIGLLNQERKLINELKDYYRGISTRPFSFFAGINHEEYRDLRRSAMQKARDEFRNFKSEDFTPDNLSLISGLGFGLLSSAVWQKIASSPSATDIDFMSQYNRFLDAFSSLEALAAGFENGAFGYGWLIIYLYRLGCIPKMPFEVLNRIDALLAECLTDASVYAFDSGAGAMLSYSVARLYAAEFDSNIDNPAFNTDLLVRIYDMAQKVIATPGCEFRTYLSAVEFISTVNGEDDTSVWEPDIRDWLQEPVDTGLTTDKETPRNKKWLMTVAALLKYS